MIAIYAEKPDMGGKFASVLGGIPHDGKLIGLKEYESLSSDRQKDLRSNGYIKTVYHGKNFIITWGMGHFGTLKEPKDLFPGLSWNDMILPIIPKTFIPKLRDCANRKQFNTVKRIFNDPDVEYIINATDYEREGELIFDYTYQLTGTKKPYKRVRINQLTEEGIKEGFSKRYSHVANLPNIMAAKSRGIADWLTGMNLTIAASTLLSEETINTGRVITPTLNLIVEREKEIDDFVSEPFYTVEALFTLSDGKAYKGVYEGEPFSKKEDAQDLIASLTANGTEATVLSVERKKGKKSAARPYDTSSLQTEANKLFKYDLDETDKIAQSLYSKGYITYPRVDSRYITEDKKDELPKIIRKLGNIREYSSFISMLGDGFEVPKRYFDNKKVQAHYAIIATGNIPSNLSEEETNIYDLIARATISMAFPPVLLEKTTVITEAAGKKFKTSGTIILDPGWSILGRGHVYRNDIPKDIVEGMTAAGKYGCREGKTTPPPYYTPGSIVTAMKTCGKKAKAKEIRELLEKMEGIGRPSTRAAIIKKLQQVKYISLDETKNIIRPTRRGTDTIAALDLPSLKSPEMSAEWEKRLDEIERSSPDECVDLANRFILDICAQTKDWCEQIKTLKGRGVHIQGTGKSGIDARCPVCLSDSLVLTKKVLFCMNCDFRLYRIFSGHRLSEKELILTLKNGQSPYIKDLKSRNGKEYSAYLKLIKNDLQDDEEKNKFPYGLKPTWNSLFKCPLCGAPLSPLKSGKGYCCSKRKTDPPECTFMFSTKILGHRLKPAEIKALLENGKSPPLSLTSKEGKKFKAELVIEEGKVQIKPTRKKKTLL